MDVVLKGKRVLLVEDNELNRELSKDVLEKEGVIVDEADDGDIAVEKVSQSKKRPYDFILMDIMMPRMSGYEATAKIRALDNKRLAGTPIIAMTAAVTPEDKLKVLEVGMNAHLSKPVSVPELLATITDFLGSYQQLEGELSKLV
ncbi:MAG: response regulator [Treponema sp.]|nr:response regulator [Treponema sp.]